MNKRTTAVLSCLVLASIAAAALRPAVLCEGFLPENDMNIPLGGPRALSGLDEAAFNRVLDRVEAVYKPIVAAKGGKLSINRLWSDGKVNAYASRLFKSWNVSMFGGLARHPVMTEEGFALVACHEIGHHIGGAPKRTSGLAWMGLGRWATNEGGADYFATLKCLRLVAPETRAELDASAVAACEASYAEPAARANCRAGALAGQSVARLFQTMRQGQPIAFVTPDKSVARSTYDGHPEPQCRLDTYFQGALCPKPVSESLSDKDHNAGACTRRDGFLVGLRPLCWYKPPKGEPAGPAVAAAPVLRPADAQRVAARLDSFREAFEAR